MEQAVGNVVCDERTCFECSYDLREQPADGLCPECGTPVSASVREDRWDQADHRWRRRVRRGVLWSIGQELALFFGVLLAMWPRAVDWAGVITFAVMGCSVPISVWLVTASNPAAGGANRG